MTETMRWVLVGLLLILDGIVGYIIGCWATFKSIAKAFTKAGEKLSSDYEWTKENSSTYENQ